MTLSQGIIKKCLLVFVLCFAMFFAFFPQSEASAAYTDSCRLDGSLYGGIRCQTAEFSTTRTKTLISYDVRSYHSKDVHFYVKDRNGKIYKSGTLYTAYSRKSGSFYVPKGSYHLDLVSQGGFGNAQGTFVGY